MKRKLNDLLMLIQLKIEYRKLKNQNQLEFEKQEREDMFNSLNPCCQKCKWVKFHLEYDETPTYYCRIKSEELISRYSKDKKGQFKAEEIEGCEYFQNKKKDIHFDTIKKSILKRRLNKAIYTLNQYCLSISNEQCSNGNCLLCKDKECTVGMPDGWDKI